MASMEEEKACLEREIQTVRKEINSLTQQTKILKKEVEEIRSTIQEVSSLLDPAEVDTTEQVFHNLNLFISKFLKWTHLYIWTQPLLQMGLLV